ncbi:hypothetical protein ACMHYB_17435 [Sorangium sp. So ce1128]
MVAARVGLAGAADRGVIDFACQLGVVEKSGAHLSFDGEHIGQGRERARAALIGKPTLATSLRAAVDAAAPARPGGSAEMDS